MRTRRLIALIVTVAAGFVAAAIVLPHSPSALRELLLSLGPAAPVMALVAWIVLVPGLFPGTVLAAAGGLAFGAVGGAALAFVGAVAGGITAFALARGCARSTVDGLVRSRPRLMRLHVQLQRRGFAAILAARLMPGVPACALHYAAGASPVRLRAFAGAIAVGALLRTVPYALLGNGLASGSILPLLVAGGSIAFGSVAAAALARHVRRAAVPVL